MGRHRSPAPRRGKRNAPVRTGLLGVTAAVALGAAAVTSGLVPVGEDFVLGGHGESGAKTTAQSSPSRSPEPRTQTAAQRPSGLKSLKDSGTQAGGSGKAPAASSKPSAKPAPATKPTPAAKPAPKAKPAPQASTKAPVRPEPSATPAKVPASAPVVPRNEATAAEAAVLALVNQERAQAGCRPVRQSPPLAALAGAFSKDMAVRGFFDHTDPDGANPWDRASNAGIGGLGGENIARGQGDADAVMAAWMNSPGHRANILNCEFRTMGVGAHFASGGPWWTQDFGF
ncbi:CAP domain-containing protein [Streptomyces sp. NPDC086023]|uniref:CAP domain-containing protein n=1 Tax=Streptomyces sp. NPDC086023 TaxID=3365746 RepID=UPI0037D761A5